jgi:hypothetical protein
MTLYIRTKWQGNYRAYCTAAITVVGRNSSHCVFRKAHPLGLQWWCTVCSLSDFFIASMSAAPEAARENS